jgi:anti-sigma factor RsiW
MNSELAQNLPLDNTHLHSHLSDAQLDNLLVQRAGAPSGADAHLLSCPQCANELACLRESISLFRSATAGYAEGELRRMPRIPMPSRTLYPVFEPVWLMTAAAMLFAVLLPLQMGHRHTTVPVSSSSTTVTDAATIAQSQSQSDEALLEDVDREASVSVPVSMQVLADPTSASPTTPRATNSASPQRN